jgi:hypothetical protein
MDKFSGSLKRKEVAMNPKKQILEFLIQARCNVSQSSTVIHSEEAGKPSMDFERVQEIFDGMSTGTARIVIDREIDRRITEKCDLKGLENKGRYYVATIVRQDGHTIASLLIDKQSGKVVFV